MFNRSPARKGMDLDVLTEIAVQLKDTGNWYYALEALEWVLEQRPHDPKARFHWSLCQLALGNYEKGWDGYASRLHDKWITALPKWREYDDAKHYTNKHVLVHSEQGIGDEIMFASCIPDLCKIAKEVRFTCDERLVTLFARSFPHARVLSRQENDIATMDVGSDIVVMAGTLPRAFRRVLSYFPGRSQMRFLHHSGLSIADSRDGLNVGLCMRGGTSATRSNLRSISEGQKFDELIGPLWNERIHFWGLDRGTVDAYADFDKVADLIASLDLVVTVQCSIAHLAGALGVPTLVLMSAAPEWRYGVHGDSMPWYPSVRLIRQSKLGDWSDVLAGVRRELLERAPRAADVSDWKFSARPGV